MLCLDPAQRYTADQALKDLWITQLSTSSKVNLRSSMEMFQNRRKALRESTNKDPNDF